MSILLLGSIFDLEAQLAKNSKYFEINTYGFIENKGQFYNQSQDQALNTKYILNLNNGLKVVLRNDGFSYEIIQKTDEDIVIEGFESNMSTPGKLTVDRIDIDFINSNKEIILEPEEAFYDQITYYNHLNTNGLKNVQHFKKIIYKNIYQYIDLVFEFDPKSLSQVKYSFIIHPGGNVDNIKLKYQGINSISTNNNELKMKVNHQTLKEVIPKSYIQENQTDIIVVYRLASNNIVEFETTEYDKHNTLVIDPYPQINWGTYFGGVLTEVKVDDSGYVYVCGSTESVSNIATNGAFQTILLGSNDACICKFNKSGQRQWSTYYGGNAFDGSNDMVITNNHVIIGGRTASTNVMATSGSHQSTYGGSYGDGFIAKFDNTGQRVWGTYYGGTGADYITSIDVDKDSNIYVTGSTESKSSISTPGSHQPYKTDTRDGFIAKFDKDGQRVWGTYYGGYGLDWGGDLVVDKASDVYVIGSTYSDTVLATSSAFQKYNGNNGYSRPDAFIVKFNTSGIRQWGTYYGGNDNDYGYGIDVDPLSNVYVIGTASSCNNMASSGAFQANNGGGRDMFLAKFTKYGARSWGTFLGSLHSEHGFDVFVDQSLNIYISGQTYDTAATFILNASQPKFAGGNDGVLAKFNSSGKMSWCTYVGGNNADYLLSAVHKDGILYVAGYTTSQTNITTPGAFQQYPNGIRNGFLLSLSDCSDFNPKIEPSNPDVCKGDSIQLEITGHKFFSWVFDSTIQDTSSSKTYIKPKKSNTYFAIVSDLNYCTDTVSTTVTIRKIPTLTSSNDDTICFGDTIRLISSGATYYSWSQKKYLNLITTREIDAFPLSTTYYYVKGSSKYGCDGYDSIKVTVIPKLDKPSIATSLNPTFCEGDSILIYCTDSVSNYINLKWNNGLSKRSISVSSSGIFALRFQDTFGCMSQYSDTIRTMVNQNPPIPVIKGYNNIEFCQYDSIFLYSDSGCVSYIWSNGKKQQNIIIDTSTSLNLVVVDSNNCKSDTSKTIIFKMLLAPSKPDLIYNHSDSLCEGDSIDISTIAGYSYTWNTGVQDRSIVVRKSGEYFVFITDSHTCRSINSDTANIVFNELPPKAQIFYLGDSVFCEGDSILLYGQNNFQYLWSTTDTTQTITVKSSSNLKLKLIDSKGCEGNWSDAFSVRVKNKPAKPIISQTGIDSLKCSTYGNKYFWFIDKEEQSFNDQIINAIERGNYQVYVELEGCISDTSSIYFFIPSFLDKENNNSSILIYPNPVSNHFTLYLPYGYENTDISIIDIQGQILGTYSVKGNEKKVDFKIANFPKGIYLCKIKHKNEIIVKRIIKY